MKAKPGRDGAITLTLEAAEALLLRDVAEQLKILYTSDADDPARARLFPRAYLDPTEEAAEQEWQAVTHPALLRDRLDGLNHLTASLAATEPKGRKVRVELSADDVNVWVQVLNDARLAFGTRLEITDDTDMYSVGPDDPLAPEKAAYIWLTALQDALITVLLGTLPG